MIDKTLDQHIQTVREAVDAAECYGPNDRPEAKASLAAIEAALTAREGNTLPIDELSDEWRYFEISYFLDAWHCKIIGPPNGKEDHQGNRYLHTAQGMADAPRAAMLAAIANIPQEKQPAIDPIFQCDDGEKAS